MAEYTLTIYLFGMMLGTLFWGKISDKRGRKPSMLVGFLIFILGCLGCYFSESITVFMICRLIQGFGGTVGSVLGQAVCRDAFHGPALGKIYSSVGSALSIFPAIGPVMGGVIAEHYGWPTLFLLLILSALSLSLLVATYLPETHPVENRKPISIKTVGARFFRDKKVMGFGLIVGSVLGISFSYYSEGSFYLIKILGLSPSDYGLSFIAIATSAMLGGLLSKKLQSARSSKAIMGYGILIILGATTLFSNLVLWHTYVAPFSNTMMIGITIGAQMITVFGGCMATSNGLALALVDYKECIGTASSLFGFFYYGVISLVTFGMGWVHNGTLLPMPLYFLSLGIFGLWVKGKMICDES
jgi:Bcr/CflA subfamily drug resistance transporter